MILVFVLDVVEKVNLILIVLIIVHFVKVVICVRHAMAQNVAVFVVELELIK